MTKKKVLCYQLTTIHNWQKPFLPFSLESQQSEYTLIALIYGKYMSDQKMSLRLTKRKSKVVFWRDLLFNCRLSIYRIIGQLQKDWNKQMIMEQQLNIINSTKYFLIKYILFYLPWGWWTHLVWMLRLFFLPCQPSPLSSAAYKQHTVSKTVSIREMTINNINNYLCVASCWS